MKWNAIHTIENNVGTEEFTAQEKLLCTIPMFAFPIGWARCFFCNEHLFYFIHFFVPFKTNFAIIFVVVVVVFVFLFSCNVHFTCTNTIIVIKHWERISIFATIAQSHYIEPLLHRPSYRTKYKKCNEVPNTNTHQIAHTNYREH